MTSSLRTPVALLIFSRPESTRQLVQAILRARPPKVLVFGDAPRPDHPEDIALVAASRAIIEEACWECEVLTNYAEINLGTKYRPATGLDWVFENVERAIFFEDDCLPHPTFFRFCDELLERYVDHEQVMMISGNNYMECQLTTDSYLFSHYVGIWGWATWRRAWQHYDVEISRWPTLRETDFLRSVLSNKQEVAFWTHCFDRICSGESRTWDHQWQFACWLRQGLSVMPTVNLCTNIGFGPTAQHYTDFHPKLSNAATGEMVFPLKHPSTMVRSRAADEFAFRELLKPPVNLRSWIGALIRAGCVRTRKYLRGTM
jgi:hypothetical protein